jgi:5-methylcytosine-specific restriction endonuclease McrA
MMTKEEKLEKKRAHARAVYAVKREEILVHRKAYRVANKEAISNRKKAQYAEDPTKTLARNKAWRDAHPDTIKELNRASYLIKREERIAKQKAYAEKRREEVLAYGRAYRVANQERLKEHARKNYVKNRDRYIAYARNREINVRASGKYSAQDIAEITEMQRGKCAYCRVDLNKVKREVDHIMPIKLGGNNTRDNLQVLCKPCNTKKKAKHPVDFARELGLLL